jgi:hypothetical protein
MADPKLADALDRAAVEGAKQICRTADSAYAHARALTDALLRIKHTPDIEVRLTYATAEQMVTAVRLFLKVARSEGLTITESGPDLLVFSNNSAVRFLVKGKK